MAEVLDTDVAEVADEFPGFSVSAVNSVSKCFLLSVASNWQTGKS